LFPFFFVEYLLNMIILNVASAIQQQCRRSISRFKKRVLPIIWTPRGILLSEGFAFCAVADLFNLDVILESGVWNGRSTEIWAKYFLPEINITAIDIKLQKEAIKRLAPYSVNLIEGDSHTLLCDCIRTFHQKRIGVFIDGPKGPAAIELGKTCLTFSNVAFVGIHDVHKLSYGKKNETRIKIEKWPKVQFFSDEDWFVETYAGLDEGESQRDDEQRITWKPYELVVDPGMSRRELGSYGPTIGFAFNS